MQKMRTAVRDYFADDEIPMGERKITLVLVYSVVSVLIGAIAFHGDNITESGKISVIAVCLSILVFIFIIRKIKMYETGLKVFSYFLNIGCLPLLYITNGGISGGMELLFIAGIIITFFLLPFRDTVAAVLIQTIWYVMVIYISYTRSGIISGVHYGNEILVSSFVTFAISASAPMIIFAFQDNVYCMQRNRVQEALKSIDAASQTKSRFLANMSHELRTPMNAIVGMAELTEREDIRHEASEELSLIRETAEGMLSTINDILTYSKIDSGKLMLQPEQYSFDRMMNEIINNISKETEDRGLDFFVNIDPGIPNILYGDDTRIMQIFQYLLFDAVSSTDSGRITMDIGYRENQMKNSITVMARISDTGEGMTREYLDTIYNSYESYDSKRDPRMKKLGLEMTICRGLLEMMKGSIKIESISDVGSAISFNFDSFIVEKSPIMNIREIGSSRVLIYGSAGYIKKRWEELMNEFRSVTDYADSYTAFAHFLNENKYNAVFVPECSFDELKGILTKDLAEQVYVVTDHHHSLGDFECFRIVRRPISAINVGQILKNKWDSHDYENPDAHYCFAAPDADILVADDNMVNVKVALELLKKYDIKAESASSGQEALDMARSKKYDMILLDQMMPEMDGTETMKHIREDASMADIPIVCMTANIGEEVRNSLINEGFQDYIAKPVKTRYLEQVLISYLPESKIVRSGGKAINSRDAQDTAAGADLETGGDEQKIHGFDMAVGIGNIGGDADTYDSILMVYYPEGMEKLHSIPEEYSGGEDLKLFTTDVHSLKGSSASIGATEMSAAFKALETAGKAGDRAFIDSELQHTLNDFRSLLEYIKEYLASRGKVPETHINTEEDDDFSDDRVLEEFDMDEAAEFSDHLVKVQLDECRKIMALWTERNYGRKINKQIKQMNEELSSGDYYKLRSQLEDFIISLQ